MAPTEHKLELAGAGLAEERNGAVAKAAARIAVHLIVDRLAILIAVPRLALNHWATIFVAPSIMDPWPKNRKIMKPKGSERTPMAAPKKIQAVPNKMDTAINTFRGP